MKSASFFAGGEQRLPVIKAGLASTAASCDHERMYAIELDRSKRLLVISAAQRVTAEQAKLAAQRVRELLQDVAPGFRVLADFRWLDSMDSAAARHIAGMMDALAEKGVVSVTRVMPDPHKDIGLNILSQFHYGPKIQIATFETLADAVQSLTEK
jgi:anti-anti-sigma regulatory factor